MKPPPIGDVFETHSSDERVNLHRHFEGRLKDLVADREKLFFELESVKKRRDQALATPSLEKLRFDPRDNLTMKSPRERRKTLRARYEQDIEKLENLIPFKTNEINLVRQYTHELYIRLNPPVQRGVLD
jgi:hypothetical protein